MDAKPTERSYGKNVVLSEGWCDNPSVLTAKSLVNKKGGCIASKTQQSDSLCLAVNPPPFDKGGKGVGAKQGILRMLNKQSVYKASVVVRSEAMDVLLRRLWGWRGWWRFSWDSAVLEGLVQARDGGVAIPPVVARIFSGDSTSPLASVVVRGEAMDVLLRKLWGWKGWWAIPQSCDR